MFQAGDVVSYGATGVCTVEDVKELSLSGHASACKEYYILRPVAAPSCVTYVPTASEKLVGKMRQILTREQIDALLLSVKGQQLAWVEDTRHRTEHYGQILSKGVTTDLLKLIACMYLEKKERQSAGKKFSYTDEKLLAAAERIVSEEFAYALNIPQSEVSQYIAEKIR